MTMYQKQIFLHPEERTPALLIHLSPLANWILPGIGFLIGPLVAWLIYRDQSRMLDEQSQEVLNYQITVLIANIVFMFIAGILFSLFQDAFTLDIETGVGLLAFVGILMGIFGVFFTLVILATLVLNIIPFIFMLIGALKAADGQLYYYPMTIRLIK